MKILEIIFKVGSLAALIAALILASVARADASERAEEQARTISEHKANEERLTNELLTVTDQKTELENGIFEEKMQKEELQSRFEGLQAEVEDLKTIIKNQAATIEDQAQKLKLLTETEPNAYASIKMTSDEMNLLEWVLALEAKNEPEVGRRGVVEEIFNRVLMDEWKGDTVSEILAANGQFDGYRIYKSGDVYATPDKSETDTINYVLKHGRTVLPEDYVYFATYKANGKDFIQIGNHYFGR